MDAVIETGIPLQKNAVRRILADAVMTITSYEKPSAATADFNDGVTASSIPDPADEQPKSNLTELAIVGRSISVAFAARWYLQRFEEMGHGLWVKDEDEDGDEDSDEDGDKKGDEEAEGMSKARKKNKKKGKKKGKKGRGKKKS